MRAILVLAAISVTVAETTIDTTAPTGNGQIQAKQGESLLSKYKTCDTEANCTAAGLNTCISGGCVDATSIRMSEIKFVTGKPNNAYFAFSLWDKNCNPAPLKVSELSSRFTVYDDGKKQSASESFNGLLSVPKVHTHSSSDAHSCGFFISSVDLYFLLVG